MNNYLNVPLAVCYPGGAGGSFVSSALNYALFNNRFNVSTNGECHGTFQAWKEARKAGKIR